MVVPTCRRGEGDRRTGQEESRTATQFQEMSCQAGGTPRARVSFSGSPVSHWGDLNWYPYHARSLAGSSPLGIYGGGSKRTVAEVVNQVCFHSMRSESFFMVTVKFSYKSCEVRTIIMSALK